LNPSISDYFSLSNTSIKFVFILISFLYVEGSKGLKKEEAEMHRVLSNPFVRLNSPFLENNGAIEQKNDVTGGF
jgi:hypothetical protein